MPNIVSPFYNWDRENTKFELPVFFDALTASILNIETTLLIRRKAD